MRRTRLSATPVALALLLVAGSAAGEPFALGPDGLVDPWAPRPSAAAVPHASWVAPEAVDVLDPWAETRSHRPTRIPIIDPWEGWSPKIPTASFPSESLVDPWEDSRR
jgi:hypothetical protein